MKTLTTLALALTIAASASSANAYPIFVKYEGIKGINDSRSTPSASATVIQSPQPGTQTALLLPAVQKVREAAAANPSNSQLQDLLAYLLKIGG
jgi:hypothetical protein